MLLPMWRRAVPSSDSHRHMRCTPLRRFCSATCRRGTRHTWRYRPLRNDPAGMRLPWQPRAALVPRRPAGAPALVAHEPPQPLALAAQYRRLQLARAPRPAPTPSPVAPTGPAPAAVQRSKGSRARHTAACSRGLNVVLAHVVNQAVLALLAASAGGGEDGFGGSAGGCAVTVPLVAADERDMHAAKRKGARPFGTLSAQPRTQHTGARSRWTARQRLEG